MLNSIKILIKLLVYGIVILLAIRYMERKNTFYPMKEISYSPMSIGLQFDNIYFNTSDGKQLNGWFVPADNAKYTMIFCHGNAGNISHRTDKIRIFHNMGINIFIFDYRGYGASEGKPTEKGLFIDIQAAFDHVTEAFKIPKEKIIVFGESLGGAVAIDLAHTKDIKALITEDTFTSVKDMAKTVYPFIPSFIYSNKFNSLAKIKDIKCAKLIIHSIDDEIVPYHMGQKLFAEAADPKELLMLRGGHNTSFMDSEEKYTKGIKNFIDRLN